MITSIAARIRFTLTLCLVLAACSPKQEEPAAAASAPLEAPPEQKAAEEPAAPAPEVPKPSDAKVLMHGHFQQASEAREALIRGDVEQAKKAMVWLSEHHDDAALPPELQPLLAQMQTAAKDFDKATTLREAGIALANTLTKCSACHRATGKGPKIGTPPLPDGTDAKAQMQRHLWAAHRMWEGLVVGSEEQYANGAKALADATLRADQLNVGANAAQADALITHVRDLASKAVAAKDDTARAEVYGHFIATCATCHRMVGRGGPPPTGATPPAADAPKTP